MDELVERFSPDRLKVSGKFYAILARLLGGQQWTDPSYAEIAITSDGHIIGALADGHDVYLGLVSDLVDNLRGVVDVVGLTEQEKVKLATIISLNITVHGDSLDVFDALDVSRPDPGLN